MSVNLVKRHISMTRHMAMDPTVPILYKQSTASGPFIFVFPTLKHSGRKIFFLTLMKLSYLNEPSLTVNINCKSPIKYVWKASDNCFNKAYNLSGDQCPVCTPPS